MTLSSLESEHNPVSEEPFPAVPLVEEVASDARALSRGQHAVALARVDAATILGSRDELASAFGNLVSNAVRYTPPGGTITLAWQVDGDGRGSFEVTDTGIGIPAEYLPQLTERFYRVDRSRSRATGGTGLGLAIVKHIALRHQGQLEIASERGKGSSFAIRLPARRVLRGRPPLPVAQGRAKQRLDLLAPDVDGRVLHHAVLRFGPGREEVELGLAEPQCAEPVRHLRGLHQFNHARGEHLARIAVGGAARVGAQRDGAAEMTLRDESPQCGARRTDC